MAAVNLPKKADPAVFPAREEADRSKKTDDLTAVVFWDEAEGEESWLEEAFWALDRIITPRLLVGFFAVASIYFLYHLTMFCLRINGYGF